MKWAGIAYALVIALLSTPAGAQSDPNAELAKLKPKDFPTQPIEFTVVYPAGGGMDVSARLLAKHVENLSGDRIIVNNRTGGAGMVGHSYLRSEEHTSELQSLRHLVCRLLLEKKNYIDN